jgi:hypothetical protein
VNPVGNPGEVVQLAGQDPVFGAFLTGVGFEDEDHGGPVEIGFSVKIQKFG